MTTIAELCVEAVRQGMAGTGTTRAFEKCLGLLPTHAAAELQRQQIAEAKRRIKSLASSTSDLEAAVGPGDSFNLRWYMDFVPHPGVTPQEVLALARVAGRVNLNSCEADVAVRLLGLIKQACELPKAPHPVILIRYACDLSHGVRDMPSLLDVMEHGLNVLLQRSDEPGFTLEQQKQVAFLSFVLEPDGKRTGPKDRDNRGIYARPWLVDLRRGLRVASRARIAAGMAHKAGTRPSEELPNARRVQGRALSAPVVEFQHRRLGEEILNLTGWPRDICLIVSAYVSAGWTIPSLFDQAIEFLNAPVNAGQSAGRRRKRARARIGTLVAVGGASSTSSSSSGTPADSSVVFHPPGTSSASVADATPLPLDASSDEETNDNAAKRHAP